MPVLGTHNILEQQDQQLKQFQLCDALKPFAVT